MKRTRAFCLEPVVGSKPDSKRSSPISTGAKCFLQVKFTINLLNTPVTLRKTYVASCLQSSKKHRCN